MDGTCVIKTLFQILFKKLRCFQCIFWWSPHVFGHGPITKKCFFLNLIFMSVRSFSAIHSVTKKIVRVMTKVWGLSEIAHFLGYFFHETLHICREARKNNILKVSLAQEINGREPILYKICITADVLENVRFYIRFMCRNLKFLTAEKKNYLRHRTFLRSVQFFQLCSPWPTCSSKIKCCHLRCLKGTRVIEQ
jgi:hypothetical protein